jgi:N-acetyl-1-D-myo-inositol-2-amino-2-deoxy-alpha-D-glucopyranoside deacetylase
MADLLTLMTVHAHPDDEAISTGGVLARYAAEGLQTVLVTCTGGEVGEIADPALAQPENLGEVREAELRAACDLLRVSHFHLLGYRDSGMAGTPDNDAPGAFWRADLDEATGQLVALVRRYRPQVLVTYDENGFYGHPDHIQANRVTVAAFHAAGDPSRYPELGPPWTPSKLYYTAVPISRLLAFGARLAEAGIELPGGDDESEPEFGTPDEQITTEIDVRDFAAVKREALALHRSQVGPESWFLRLPPELWLEAFGTEHFVLAAAAPPRAPAGGSSEREDDLFDGLRHS